MNEFRSYKGGEPSLHAAMLAMDAEREAQKLAQTEAAVG